ncbi:SRPBCC family protein [Gordonia soli]|uniref:Uncharacterized protein n=1 Tax=Gordonia soli NBRC 108243 TaxID=1223545 RepID=M0QEL6_9ACTN|nr:SRPBCC family protein [Gordonia soli]GAC67035.1 hypothetical protein GS4_05_02480 [Gordonia soli NBRC 108243]
MSLHRTFVVAHPRDEVFAWHARPGAVRRLMPLWMPFRIVDEAASLADGTAVFALPGGLRWVARHDPDAYDPPSRFVDEVSRGGVRSLPTSVMPWRHTHRFEALDDGHTRLIDDIDAPLPATALLPALAYRHQQLADDLDARARWADLAEPPTTVTIAAADPTSAVAAMLRAHLTTSGVEVVDDPLDAVASGRPDVAVVVLGEPGRLSDLVTAAEASPGVRVIVSVSRGGSHAVSTLPSGSTRRVRLQTGWVVTDGPPPRVSGKGVLPWIDLDDLLDVVVRAIGDPHLSGDVVAAAPAPASGDEIEAVIRSSAAGLRRLGGLDPRRQRESPWDPAGTRPTELLDAGHRFRRPFLADAVAYQTGALGDTDSG